MIHTSRKTYETNMALNHIESTLNDNSFIRCYRSYLVNMNYIQDIQDIYEAIAERYLQIGCSVMTPNKNRYELLGRLIEEYKVDGVVEMTLQACHTYNVEARSIEKFVKGKGVPYIHVETDYSQEDIGQLNTRMTAFVEML